MKMVSVKSNIATKIQDLIKNHERHVIHSSTDYNIITIGDLQIEALDWRWVSDLQLSAVLNFTPHDWRFKHNLDDEGRFKITKYGLTDKISLGSYSPLWPLGAKPEIQAKIMWQEMEKMQEHGAMSCKDGLEILPQSPIWNLVDGLTTKSRNAFREQLSKKFQEMMACGIRDVDGVKLWNDFGARITPEILDIVKHLDRNLYKHVVNNHNR